MSGIDGRAGCSFERRSERDDVLNDIGNFIQGELRLDGAFEVRGLVHSVDDRAVFILAEGQPAGGENGLAAVDSVAAHAGHQEADRRAAVNLGCGSEQHVDRRPMTADRRIIRRARRERAAAFL